MSYYEEVWTWTELAGELRARGIDLSEINNNSILCQSVIQHLDEHSPSAAAERISEDIYLNQIPLSGLMGWITEWPAAWLYTTEEMWHGY